MEQFDNMMNRLHDMEKKSTDYILKDQFSVVVNDIKNLTVMINVNTENLTFLTTDFSKLKTEFGKLDGPNRGEFDLLKTRVEVIENQMANVRKQVEAVLNRMKGMSGGSADPGAMQECLDALARLRNEFE